MTELVLSNAVVRLGMLEREIDRVNDLLAEMRGAPTDKKAPKTGTDKAT